MNKNENDKQTKKQAKKQEAIFNIKLETATFKANLDLKNGTKTDKQLKAQNKAINRLLKLKVEKYAVKKTEQLNTEKNDRHNPMTIEF